VILDYTFLEALRSHHPAWRLLRSDHAALVASFLNQIFVAPNVRVMAAAGLAEALEDTLFALRERFGPDAFPRPALEYLNEWAGPERGWLRIELGRLQLAFCADVRNWFPFAASERCARTEPSTSAIPIRAP
jgi:hypothetical protein